MGRPKTERIVRDLPTISFFKPQGIPVVNLLTENLVIEEFEALSLKHYEKLNQIECAKKMHISQSTFSRILEEAHEKITRALVEGKAIKLSGGTFGIRKIILGYGCSKCLHEWEIDCNEKLNFNILNQERINEVLPLHSDITCPKCNSKEIYRLKKEIITKPK